jgi:TrmH family RNA methyltransferase
MKNFGLRRLTLVDSCVGKWTKAHQMAVKADDVLQDAKSSDDLAAVLAPARWVVGTTDNPPAGVRVLTPREVAAETLQRGAPTLLFGGEVNGLHPEELLRCHAVSVIPTAPEQPSINLAQAVCLYAAELFHACHSEPAAAAAAETAADTTSLASTEMLQRLEIALRHLLETSSWNDRTRPKDAIAQLMQPLYRAHLTDAEVNGWLVAYRKAAWR